MSPRALTAAPDDRSMWRRALARLHPDGGGSHDLFIWAGVVRDVLAGDQPTGPAAVANQLINTRLRAIELERKIREAEEIEERVVALERSIRPRSQGGGRWGA